MRLKTRSASFHGSGALVVRTGAPLPTALALRAPRALRHLHEPRQGQRSGSRLACLPLPFICLPLLFTCLPLLFICLPGWVLVVGFPAGLSPTSFHLSSGRQVKRSGRQMKGSRLGACGRVPALFRWPCGVRPFPLMSALFRWPCSISIRLSPRSVTAGVRPCPLAM